MYLLSKNQNGFQFKGKSKPSERSQIFNRESSLSLFMHWHLQKDQLSKRQGSFLGAVVRCLLIVKEESELVSDIIRGV